MFPIRDDNPQVLTPYVTYGIVALNVLIWLGVQGAGAGMPLAQSICTLGLVPGELLGSLPAGFAVPIGEGLACVVTTDPNPSSLLTHMFLHGSWLHLLGNLWFLWIFGDNVEDSMGHLRFAVFYVLCGLAAAALQIASGPTSGVPMVGASGAIGGVMGAYVVLYPWVNVHMLFWFGFYVTTFAIPAVWMLGYWFLVQMVSGLASGTGQGGGVAFWAHVGGFLGGAILIFAFRDPRLLARHPYYGWRGRSSSPYRRLR
ncbi:MAG: rhomboid family intramembrane serine protease [Gammaproteobacteria bacterium]